MRLTAFIAAFFSIAVVFSFNNCVEALSDKDTAEMKKYSINNIEATKEAKKTIPKQKIKKVPKPGFVRHKEL